MLARAFVAVMLLASSATVRLKPDATDRSVTVGSATVRRMSDANASVVSAFRRTAPRIDATIVDGVYEGEYRSWYPSGRLFEIRHYVHGHEEGLQQAWTESGTLYINYEARNGRHYGMENSTPCVEPAEGDSARAALPFYDTRDFMPRWQPVAHRVADFTMTTQMGKTVTNRDLAGHLYIASFIYTRCAAVCPLVVRQLSRLQAATRDMPDVTIVSFTVTPATDSPRVLAAFGRDRGIDPARWLLLTGDKREIYALARQSYFADDDRASDFLHTEKIVLVDRSGHLRGVYNGTQPFQIDQLAGDIARLRAIH